MERSKPEILTTPSGAIFSANRRSRYILWRRFKPGDNFINIIMLNPSQANEHENDPTIRRCIQFAKDLDGDALIVTNLFSYCTAYPEEIKSNETNLSAQNRYYLTLGQSLSKKTICAWGNHGGINKRSVKIRKLLKDQALYCFDINQNGEPKHPLYIKKTATLKSFN